ncbi:MAG TPA: bifunctional oligoribonuclease/PAP phosphatase NrnA [Chthoniobacteraceae bacterium]|nr:bifunctional oligoribonuclease/PAP phosphatase NrnA [Chthoniobacteraceae bacterium]
MPTNTPLEKIADVLQTRQRFVVMSHVRPDGDALGCTIAMALCLKALGKDVTAWNEEGVLEKFRYLPGNEIVTTPADEAQEFDVAIVLDTSVQDRVGKCLPAVKHAGIWINIDHHITNPRFGDLVHIDSTAPATGQILYELFRAGGLPFTYEMADNLFVAISTDTGSFQYSGTTAKTYEIAAELIKAGVNVAELSRKMYENYPRRRLELLRALLNTLQFSSDDRCGSVSLSQATAAELGVLPEDNEGLIDHIRAIQGVQVAAFFEELGDGKVRVSLRSKDERVDVSKVCGLFGGGGHMLAAGARIKGSLAEVQERVAAAIDAAINAPAVAKELVPA